MLESAFQKRIIHDLDNAGALTFNVHGHGFQKSGWPDIQVYSPIWTGHLELKTGTRPKDLQRIIIKKLNERGTKAYFLRLKDADIIVRNWEWETLAVFGNWLKMDGKRGIQLLEALRDL
jgi:hypothetical protein